MVHYFHLYTHGHQINIKTRYFDFMLLMLLGRHKNCLHVIDQPKVLTGNKMRS